jgi:Fur family transcriptional regulator, ferric uptake regulator
MQQSHPSPSTFPPDAMPNDLSLGQAGGAEIIRSPALRGRRLTGPRQEIVNFVAPRQDHYSAQEVWEDLRASRKGVGRATVFRTLELLVELGVLDRVHAGDGCHRYAICETRHHHHLVCLDCPTVVLIMASEIEERIGQMAVEADFELLTHHLELIGRCANCRERPESPADKS